MYSHDPVGQTLATNRKEVVDARDARDFTTFGCEACRLAVEEGGPRPRVQFV